MMVDAWICDSNANQILYYGGLTSQAFLQAPGMQYGVVIEDPGWIPTWAYAGVWRSAADMNCGDNVCAYTWQCNGQ